jgi:hypothetical protein
MIRSTIAPLHAWTHRPSQPSRIATAALAVVMLWLWPESRLTAQQPAAVLSPQAIEQISALTREKQSRTPAQRKMSSQLIYALKAARREPIPAGLPAQFALPDANTRGVVLDLRAAVTDRLLADLRALGGEILDARARYDSVRLRIDLLQAEAVAALPEVTFVQPKQEAMTMRLAVPNAVRNDAPNGGPAAAAAPLPATLRQRKPFERATVIAAVQHALGGPVASVGSQSSQGDIAHKANVARATYGVSGAGVKVGVLSDGVGGLAASQALGDLGTVNVLAGQAGSGAEGTAMLEIIHDLAPDAELYFATAFTSIASFADNIRALRAAGCDIIVDDVAYFAESPFQDGQSYTSPTNGGIVSQAVKDVVASGALYFSSAANSGNKNDGTSGTWEGNFVDGGAAGLPLTGLGQLHSFGGQTYNSLVITSDNPTSLFWSDPLGASATDYDLYRLDSTGTSVLAFSSNFQDGNDDPFEIMGGGSIGDRIVILKYSGADRFLHLATNRNRLSVSTAGETHGHATTTALNSFSVAATPAQNPGPFPNPFNAANKVETFSSDGLRRLFFTDTGAAFTPGNVLATGGLVLQKPDLTAADGVSVTGSGGFPNPFYGTSAAAPHAAAIAALVKSRNLAQSATQIRTALFASAIDIEATGVDRDSGIGIIMADTAVGAAIISTRREGDLDGDRRSDLTVFRPGSGHWYTLRSGAGYTTYSDYQWGDASDLRVPADYDGDGKTDIAIYRPSTGTWWVLTSASNFTTFLSFAWGNSTDAPVPRDFDGDGKADIAVYRPSTGTWWVLQSSTGYATYVSYLWGDSTDVPVPRDYDGDGKADIAIFRPSTGTWWVLKSGANYTTFAGYPWGDAADLPVPADYDGDGKTDIAIFRPSTGTWWVLQSSTNFVNFGSYQWGDGADVPMPADYDGDGKADVAIYRPSTGTWWWLLSTTGSTGYTSYRFGESGDRPVR